MYTLFSVLFLCIPVVSSPDFSLDMHFIHVGPFQRSFVISLSALAWFYLSAFALIPGCWDRNRKGLFLICALACMALVFALEHNLGGSRQMGGNMRGMAARPRFHSGVGEYIRILIPFALATVSAFLLRIYRRNRLMEQMAMRARLQELQYQLQPHFLFNTLNNLYALSITEPSKAPEAILKLAEILRVLLHNDNRDEIPVTEEIDFCRKYIALQQLKFGDAVKNWDIRIVDEGSGRQIAPFLVIPIIENVFKYGVAPGEKNEIVLHIHADNREFRIHTRNFKVSTGTDSLMESNRNGLQKTIRRLELIYGSDFDLAIDDAFGYYDLTLSIALK